MKQQIERQLRNLIGLPLGSIGRSTNLLWIGFGNEKAVRDGLGEQVEAEYKISIQCSWRITKDNKIFVASKDFYIPREEVSFEDFDWDEIGSTICDEKIEKLNRDYHSRVFVENISGDIFGGAEVTLSNKMKLFIFPDQSSEGEQWRLFRPGTDDEHLVISNDGVEFE